MSDVKGTVIGEILTGLLLFGVEGIENFPYSQIAGEQLEASIDIFSYVNPRSRVSRKKLADVVSVHPVIGELLEGRKEVYGRFAMQEFFQSSFRRKSMMDESYFETYIEAIDAKHRFVRCEGKKLLQKKDPKFVSFNQIYNDYINAYTDMVSVSSGMDKALSGIRPELGGSDAELRGFIGQFMKYNFLMESIRLFMQSDYIVANNAGFVHNFPIETFRYSDESPAIYGKSIANRVMRTITDYAAEEMHNKLAVLYSQSKLEGVLDRVQEAQYRSSSPFSFNKGMQA